VSKMKPLNDKQLEILRAIVGGSQALVTYFGGKRYIYVTGIGSCTPQVDALTRRGLVKLVRNEYVATDDGREAAE
jgi:hypothetical protein